MNKIRLLIVDDHAIIRAGIRVLLSAEADIDVIGEAGDGEEGIAEALRLKPDVILMDFSMPVKGGIEATGEIRKLLPNVKVLVLTMHESEEYFFPMLQAGASGYMLKGSEPETLPMAIRDIVQGNVYLSPLMSKVLLGGYMQVSSDLQKGDNFHKLSDREKEVLQLGAQGKTNKEIADELFLSVRTVEKHRASMMAKLELNNRTELIKYAIAKGLIDMDRPIES